MKTTGVDRRQFLAVSGVGLGPLVVGVSPPAILLPRKKISIAVIGVGIRARSLTRRYLLKDERVVVRAVCDVVKARRDDAKAFVDKANGNQDCEAVVDYREILARRDIDAVLIGTPDHWHTTQVIHAAVAGKDIYCEKPLTHTLREGRAIVEAVKKHKVVFQTGSQQRTEFGKKFVRAAECIRNGRIGRILNVNVGVGDPSRAYDLKTQEPDPGADWDRWLGPAAMRGYNEVLCPKGIHRHFPQWRRYWDFAGGGVADMGAHHFDIVQWALGMDEAGPIAAHPPIEQGQKRGGWLEYASGIKVVHGGPSGATFVGTEGMIHVGRGSLIATPKKILDEKEVNGDRTLPRHKNHIDNWLQCIRSRETPICSAEIGARSAAVCQLLNLAYRHHRTITWDPKAWKFADDEPTAWMDYDRRNLYPLPQA